MYRLLSACFAIVGCAMVVGCGGPAGDPNRPATVVVTGTVTHNGQPVEGATVAFLPKVPSDPGASGRTDASGKFTLTAFEPGDGAVPGSYLVTVVKTEIEGGAVEQEDSTAAPVMPKSLIPERYNNPQGSGLTAEVKDGEANEFTFELKD